MYSYKYPHPAITAYCIVFARYNGNTKLLLIKRKNHPCKGSWAFPGGFMNIDETTEDAARRELREETGLAVDRIFQVGAFSKVDRDPRERVVTIAYYTVIDHPTTVQAGDDAGNARWFDIDGLPELAFDHADILKEAIRMYRENEIRTY